MATTPEVKLRELLESFGVGMLVTHTQDDKLRSRPMALATVDGDGRLYFVTDKHSVKVDEMQADNTVAVTMQDKGKFVSLSGHASMVDDRAKLAELWKTDWKVWFPKGKDDPNLMLVAIDGVAGEYWDYSGTSGLKYLIEAGKSLLTGERPDMEHDPKRHGKGALSAQ